MKILKRKMMKMTMNSMISKRSLILYLLEKRERLQPSPQANQKVEENLHHVL
jgi:hypothetical protein